MTLSALPARTPATAARVMLTSLVAGVIAAVANVIILAIGNAAIDGSVQVSESFGSDTYTSLGAAEVAGSSLISAVAAGALYAALTRWAPARARTIFLVTCAVVLVVSFAGPLALDIPGSQQLILSVMHVAAAAVVVALVPRSRPAAS